MDRSYELSVSTVLLLCFVRFVRDGRSLVFVYFPYYLVKIFLKTKPMSVILRKTKGWL